MADITRERIEQIVDKAFTESKPEYTTVAQRISAALLAELSPPAVATHAEPVAVPDGYVLVPIEPTEEMKRALFTNLANADDEAKVIKAIIKAAPPVATQSQGEDHIVGVNEMISKIEAARELLLQSAEPFDKACMLLADLTPALSHTEEK